MEILHETQVFSPMDVFVLYTEAKTIRIEAHENYQKRSLRNKYHIQTANGIQSLTIPLKSGKNRQMPITSVEISYEEHWPKLHLHAIQSAYGKSPFYAYYQETLENLFRSGYKFLYEFNLAALQWALKTIGFRTDLCETENYIKAKPDEPLSYRNLPWPIPEVRKAHPAPYVQVWSAPGTFCYHLSILDLIFCNGPGSLAVLKASSLKK